MLIQSWICAKTMNPVKKQQEEQNLSKQQNEEIFLVNKNSVFNTPKKQPYALVESESVQKKQKCSMSRLCQSFLDSYEKNPSELVVVSAKHLADEFNVKLRRIYDLMNILQGLGSVQKLDQKGNYKWKGINRQLGEMPSPKKLQSNSLKQVAARMKMLIFQSKRFLTFTEINDKLFEEDRQIHKKQVNPISLRRRIYQCCKILKILGLIDRVDKRYIWADRDPLIKNNRQELKYQIRRARRITITQNELIQQITKRYKTPQALKDFIQKIYTSLKCEDPTTTKKENDELIQ